MTNRNSNPTQQMQHFWKARRLDPVGLVASLEWDPSELQIVQIHTLHLLHPSLYRMKNKPYACCIACPKGSPRNIPIKVQLVWGHANTTKHAIWLKSEKRRLGNSNEICQHSNHLVVLRIKLKCHFYTEIQIQLRNCIVIRHILQKYHRDSSSPGLQRYFFNKKSRKENCLNKIS